MRYAAQWEPLPLEELCKAGGTHGVSDFVKALQCIFGVGSDPDKMAQTSMLHHFGGQGFRLSMADEEHHQFYVVNLIKGSVYRRGSRMPFPILDDDVQDKLTLLCVYLLSLARQCVLDKGD